MDPKDKSLESGGNSPACRIAARLVTCLDASEITITFKPKWDVLRDDEIRSIIQRYFTFLPFNSIKEILLIPEYGDNSRLHYHGIIRANKKELSELKKFLRSRFGFSTISMIRQPEKYLTYLFKEHPEEEDTIYRDYEDELIRMYP